MVGFHPVSLLVFPVWVNAPPSGCRVSFFGSPLEPCPVLRRFARNSGAICGFRYPIAFRFCSEVIFLRIVSRPNTSRRLAGGRAEIVAGEHFDFYPQSSDDEVVRVTIATNILIQRAAAELKIAGAREIYVFGSAAKVTDDDSSDLDLAVSGLPPAVFYRMGARVSDLVGRSVDLIDLDISTPFTRHLRTENELVRVG